MTADYTEVRLKLTPRQINRLAHGEKVRLKSSDLDGDILVLLTQTQVGKVEKARTGGKGMDLKLSEAQIKACCEHKIGGGIFGDALKSVGRFAKKVGSKAMPLAKQLAGKVLSQYGPAGVDFVADQIGNRLGAVMGNPTLERFLKQGLKLGAKLTREQLESLSRGLVQGSGVKGAGLFLPGTV